MSKLNELIKEYCPDGWLNWKCDDGSSIDKFRN